MARVAYVVLVKSDKSPIGYKPSTRLFVSADEARTAYQTYPEELYVVRQVALRANGYHEPKSRPRYLIPLTKRAPL